MDCGYYSNDTVMSELECVRCGPGTTFKKVLITYQYWKDLPAYQCRTCLRCHNAEGEHIIYSGKWQIQKGTNGIY